MSETEGRLIFSTDIRVANNNRTTCHVPDMTHRFMVPQKLEILELTGPKDNKEEQPVKDIICRVFSGIELCNLAQPFFQENNVIDLAPYFGFVERNGRLYVEIQNKDKISREFRVVTYYTFSYGDIIHQECNVNFENVISNITQAGRCSKLAVTFNRAVDSLSFMTTSRCLEGDWIESFSAEVSGDPDEVFVFNFVNDLQDYIDDLKYMTLKVNAPEDGPILNAYITAWGYPHTSK